MTHSIRFRTDPKTRLAATTALLCGIWFMAAAGLALADETATKAETAAKAHFKSGQTAYKLGDYAQAIQRYEAAYREMPEAAFLFNVAQAHRMQYRIDRDIKHLHKAISLYKAYLRDTKEPQNREMVEKMISELRDLLADIGQQAQRTEEPGVIELRGIVGAQVMLDGRTIGTLPLTAQVAAGSHIIRVQKPGFEPWEQSVTVTAGANLEVPVDLKTPGDEAGPAASPPIYKRWWFWTAIGVVVAAGAGTGIYFATRGDDVEAMPTIDMRALRALK